MKLKLGVASGDRIPAKRSPDGNPHWGGAGWVRLGQYADQLLIQDIEMVVGTLVWNRDHFSIDVSEGDSVLVDVDVIYLQRLMHRGLNDRIKEARALGQVIINDLDDWYWGLSTSNKAYQSSHPRFNAMENINHYKSVLTSSSCVTVSTPYLADRLSSFVHCPIHVIPNYVDVARFTVHEPSSNNVPLLGWVGSTSHRSGDLEIMNGILRPMVDANEIRFVHSGYHESAAPAYKALGLREEDVEVLPAVDPEKYPSLLVMDVGIAPLSDVPFNHAKSEIKALEYSAAGIPWIGSALPAYTSLANDWGVGRVAKRPKDWIKHIRALRDPHVRATEGEALRQAVWQRDIEIGAKNLSDFLASQL